MDLVTENRLARRRAILATARRMIAEHGFESITIRQLAEACRVSVPTLYNQFGGKDRLLAAAIEDHFSAGPGPLELDSDLSGVARISALFDFITARFMQAPAFHRRMLEAFSSLESTQDVQRKLSINLTREIARELETMRSRNELLEWIDINLLAGQVTTAFISAAVVWGTGGIPEDHLEASVQYSTGLVLMGPATETAGKQIESRVARAQTRLRKRTAGTPGSRRSA